MLSIRNIVKHYAEHIALDDVSIEIAKGSIFGLLGPNGAGKTSLIRIINQITAPDSGSIYLNGEKLNSSHISLIGYLPEERGLYKKMEIGEQMLYLAQLKGLSKTEAVKRIRHWFEKLEIQSWWNKKVEELSKGMQQKVQFVATVVHQPPLIILDEPFTGFDPINADIIKNEILELNEQGTTIIFSTHRMESVEELCDSIALLHKSKKILDGKVRDIKTQYKTETYRVEYEGDLLVVTLNPAIEIVSNKKSEHGNEVIFRINNPPAGKPASNFLLEVLLPHITIHNMREVVPSMNDIFIKKVRELN